MKAIIAGSRHLPTSRPYTEFIDEVVSENKLFDIETIIHGCASGVDSAGDEWGSRHLIPRWEFPADWEQYGKAAGHIRNRQMAQAGDILIAIWDGKSKGTKNMIQEMERLGKPVYLRIVH